MPTFHVSLPVSRKVVMSPRKAGAMRISPGPVYVEVAISPPVIIFFMENLTAPRRVTVGDMDIMTPVEFKPSTLTLGNELACRKNHLTRFGIEGTQLRQLQRQDRVAIPMTDPIASAIERPHIILCGAHAHKMRRGWRSTRHL